MSYIASLPWYWFEWKKKAYEEFWGCVHQALESHKITGDVPSKLSGPEKFRSHWASENLLISQCCGYQIATGAPVLRVVAAPYFDLPRIPRGFYRSVIVTNKDKHKRRSSIEHFRGLRAAINEDQSYSGHTALLCKIPSHLRGPDFFKEVVPFGSHLKAMEAIAENRADIAAIDEITFKIIADDEAVGRELTSKLREIGHTDPARAPPYVTSPARPESEIQIMRDILVRVSRYDEKAKAALKSLHIQEIVDATNEDYLQMGKQIEQVEREAGL